MDECFECGEENEDCCECWNCDEPICPDCEEVHAEQCCHDEDR